MKKLIKVNVSEQEFEDLVRRRAGEIEDGLAYLDQQKRAAGGRLDVLMVDNEKSLVVVELKVTQDDGMLRQALGYYDYVATHVEALARMYNGRIDPDQKVRLLLVAPVFSQALVNWCKWLNLPVSLFTFTCLKVEGEADIYPTFTEVEIIPPPPPIQELTSLVDHLNYIKDETVREIAATFLEEIRNWKPENIISAKPNQDYVSMKVNGHVFAYFFPRRHFFYISTYDQSPTEDAYAVKTDSDLAAIKPKVKEAMEKRMK